MQIFQDEHKWRGSGEALDKVDAFAQHSLTCSADDA